MTARFIATQILGNVIEKKMHLSFALEQQALLKANDKALVQELCYGSLRWFLQLNAILDALLEKPIRKKDSLIKYLIIIGLYQLKYMRIPNHAVVSETVKVCKKIKKESAKGLVNAILRRYLREQDELNAMLNRDDNSLHAHPDWLIDALQADWPLEWRSIVKANNQKPPMYLRVNQQKTTREAYLKKLSDAGLEAASTPFSKQGIKLNNACQVEDLPGFYQGMVSVQDLSAQLACQYLKLQPDLNILDACAGPGGKSAHILESQPLLQRATLIEKVPARAKKIEQTLQRVELNAELIIDDVCHIDSWWDGEHYDRILLDAPCSASGVIRRHPDIKLLRTQEDVEKINHLQSTMLQKLWNVLKPGGILLYVTCSVLKIENTKTIENFIKQHNDCELDVINDSCGADTGYGLQILPGDDDMDGFFYARLKKN